jgi:hypothetical protein
MYEEQELARMKERSDEEANVGGGEMMQQYMNSPAFWKQSGLLVPCNEGLHSNSTT